MTIFRQFEYTDLISKFVVAKRNHDNLAISFTCNQIVHNPSRLEEKIETSLPYSNQVDHVDKHDNLLV